MAKMFYTLEETAEKLGVEEQAVRDMASRNELQQYRDGGKLMFKRDEVDGKAGAGDSGGIIPLADSGSSDVISLQDDTAAGASAPGATGVSVFDTSEVDAADPMAQTQVTGPLGGDEDLSLESVGSGSGLLDLTRESDDTSLGAELLDDVYSGSGTDSDIKMDSAVGSSGVFDSAVSMETAGSGPSGLENLSGVDDASLAAPGPAVSMATVSAGDEDSAGSGFGGGVLLVAMVTLILGLFVGIPAVAGVKSSLVSMLVSESGNYQMVLIVCAALFVVGMVFGAVGMVIGKR